MAAIIAKLASARMAGRGRGTKLIVTDLDKVINLLKDLDEDYYKEFRQEAKNIAKPVQGAIQKSLRRYTRANPPLSGMRQVHFGRVAWGTDYAPAGYGKPKPYDSALIEVPRRLKPDKKGYRPIVRVVVGSPGTVLADMAGASNKFTRAYKVTKPYAYMYTIAGQKVPGERQHRITTQGLEMISNLGSRASRYVWKGAEKEIKSARKEMEKAISKLNKQVSAKIRRAR